MSAVGLCKAKPISWAKKFIKNKSLTDRFQIRISVLSDKVIAYSTKTMQFSDFPPVRKKPVHIYHIYNNNTLVEKLSLHLYAPIQENYHGKTARCEYTLLNL